MAVRYLLCPGLVRSRIDGDVHLVTATQLTRLYGVPLSDCVVLPESPAHHCERMALMERVRIGELIGLTPRFNGDYQLPDISGVTQH